MKKGFKPMLLMLIMMMFWSGICFGDNPVIKETFTADPAALEYRGRVYLYTGHDEAAVGGGSYVMNDWLCFSSSDLVNWTRHGEVLWVDTFSWAKADAWAGQVVHRDGKFYWYICAEHATIPGKAIGVAVSSSPTGPFVDARGSALITNNMTTQTSISWDDIDPTVFIDDDGQAYLYWGNTVCKYAKLKRNMIEIDGAIHTVSLPNFTEAPWLHKRNGIYYLSYAHGWPEQIAYATSSGPTGPWTYRGIINGVIPGCGTNHQAIIDFKGASYFIYHNAALPTGGDYRRSVCIERLYYNADGTIQPIIQTSTGLDGVKTMVRSVNYPSYYIRHVNFDVVLDSYLDPRMDSQWQIVPGLANANGYVSFQSVSYPGYYLRHSGYDLQLVKNDGSDLFKADATFKQVSGLAGSGYSFQSYNYPERYLRHYEYLLRIDPISTDLDRQDATFNLISD